MAQEKDNYQHIVRIANTDLKGEKSAMYGMGHIKGVGFMFAHAVLRVAGIEPNKKLGSFTKEETARLTEILEKPGSFGIPEWMFNKRKEFRSGQDLHLLGNDWIFAMENDIKLMKKTKSYKGIRHMQGAPVRGQRTRSNFRKNKGKVQGVQRRKVAAPAAK